MIFLDPYAKNDPTLQNELREKLRSSINIAGGFNSRYKLEQQGVEIDEESNPIYRQQRDAQARRASGGGESLLMKEIMKHNIPQAELDLLKLQMPGSLFPPPQLNKNNNNSAPSPFPDQTSSTFHVYDRRVNLDSVSSMNTNPEYTLLRKWVADDPYRVGGGATTVADEALSSNGRSPPISKSPVNTNGFTMNHSTDNLQNILSVASKSLDTISNINNLSSSASSNSPQNKLTPNNNKETSSSSENNANTNPRQSENSSPTLALLAQEGISRRKRHRQENVDLLRTQSGRLNRCTNNNGLGKGGGGEVWDISVE